MSHVFEHWRLKGRRPVNILRLLFPLFLNLVYFIVPVQAQQQTNGLEGTYYFFPYNLAQFTSKPTPDMERVDSQINFSFNDTNPPFQTIGWSCEWTGNLDISQAGQYSFQIEADDGAVLSIDSNIEIDLSGVHDLETQSVSVNLSAGKHTVELDYFENGAGTAVIKWLWKQPGVQNFQIVPSNILEPSSGQEIQQGIKIPTYKAAEKKSAAPSFTLSIVGVAVLACVGYLLVAILKIRRKRLKNCTHCGARVTESGLCEKCGYDYTLTRLNQTLHDYTQ